MRQPTDAGSTNSHQLLVPDREGDRHILSAIRKNPAVRVLSEGPYRWFLLSNLAVSIGEQLRSMAQSWLILELGGSQVWVGAANSFSVAPSILLSLIAGVLIDQLGGRRVLLWDRAGQFLLAVVTVLLVLTGRVEVVHVVILSTIAGTMAGLGNPSSRTLVVQIVAPENLQSANSLNTFAYSIARALGPMAAGLLIAGFGLGAPWIALTGMCAIAVVCLRVVPDVRPERTTRESAWKSLVAGIRYVRTEPVVSRIMILAFTVIAALTIGPVWPVYARDRFQVGETGFGVMMGVFALGQGLSAVYVSAHGEWKRKAVPILYSSTMWSVTMVVFGFSRSYPLSLVALFLMGRPFRPGAQALSRHCRHAPGRTCWEESWRSTRCPFRSPPWGGSSVAGLAFGLVTTGCFCTRGRPSRFYTSSSSPLPESCEESRPHVKTHTRRRDRSGAGWCPGFLPLFASFASFARDRLWAVPGGP